MSIQVSPLDLLLDSENPRFVVLGTRDQKDIRKYLVTYEDVPSLANEINNYGNLLPGERIVALKEGGNYVVIEGNRRTCSLQMLLDRKLIPDGFKHCINKTANEVIKNCTQIEIDLVKTREAALELMAKRHIEGVKQWKPLAKKQFFASNFKAGRTIENLSSITGIKESEIKADIKDYNFFSHAYDTYCQKNPEYDGGIMDLKIEPFLRIFKVKFSYKGELIKPVDFLKMKYDEKYNTLSDLPEEVFNDIIQKVFIAAIIDETINTRNTLIDVGGIECLLECVLKNHTGNKDNDPSADDGDGGKDKPHEPKGKGRPNRRDGESGRKNPSGGPPPGGPPPREFFETLSWSEKLLTTNSEHQGLLIAVHELYNLSINKYNGKKAYEIFPVATGMVLRTAYEQVLILRVNEVGLWGDYMKTVNKKFPTLQGIEKFILNNNNKNKVLPTQELRSAMDIVQTYSHREFLNANIHNPGNISVTADSLSGIAKSGMFILIQNLINLL